MKIANRAIAPLCLLIACTTWLQAQQPITSDGKPAQLDIRAAGDHSVRITLKPIDFKADFPENPAIDDITYPAPAISLTEISETVTERVGNLTVSVQADPLTVTVTNAAGEMIQRLAFDRTGKLTFNVGDEQVLGMGEGGPKPAPGENWRDKPIEYDRRGRYHKMEPRWQSDAYGSRNPAAVLWGTQGWGIFVATPWVEVDLTRDDGTGQFIPWKAPTDVEQPQTQHNQHEQYGKGRHPVKDMVPGLYDLFVFDAHEPTLSLKDFATITGPAAMPPKWAMGYMQSHRTLEDEDQMIGIVDTFRARNIPLDAVIYLGTGFAPRGWNEEQPSFEPHPQVFKREPKAFFDDMKARNTKVVLHMVPYDRDKLPTLQGTIPPKPGEVLDNSHILNYWKLHENLVNMGTTAFWPDEGDWFNLYERIKRHQLYYQGSLYTTPNVRPWSLQRNGFPGIAKWGGWVWSGDTQSTWKTLEGQIAVGLNYSLSIGPFWGSDIGGFYVTSERTGEMYTRWFQFAAFCGSFRSHTRTWHLGLPWGWGLDDMGPKEDNGRNEPSTDPDRIIAQSEMNNPLVEPIVKKYDELRYQLLPYNYTLAAQARNEGLPMMRAMWLYYPHDEKATSLGDQYLWGRDLLIAPVYQKGATQRAVYLPEGEWYDWWTNEKETGKRTISRDVDLATMPIYVRAGAIIPVDPIRQYAMQEVNGPTTIKVYRGADGTFTLYEDDGITLGYEKGEYTETQFTWNDASLKLTITPTSTGAVHARTYKVELLPEGTVKEINYTGNPVEVSFN